MKNLLLLLLFAPCCAFAQQPSVAALEQKIEALTQQTDSLMIVVQRQQDELLSSRAALLQLIEEVGTTKNLMTEELAHLRKENEVLREIMKNYVKQIDELNTLNLQLERSLYDCTNKSMPPEKQK